MSEQILTKYPITLQEMKPNLIHGCFATIPVHLCVDVVEAIDEKDIKKLS